MATSINKYPMTIVAPLIDTGAQKIFSSISFVRLPLGFSACDKMAAFYRSKNVDEDLRVSTLGGKSYQWQVDMPSKSYHVFCACNEKTFGLGYLSVSEEKENTTALNRFFRKTSEVDKDTGEVFLTGVMFSNKKKVTLPGPKT
jgi:hypothetical protein